jgi:hypothetical protein
MYGNPYLPIQNLSKSAVNSGGLCRIVACKWEDVLEFPEIDPLTGICAGPLQLKEGTDFITIPVVDKDRLFSELMKVGTEGVFFDITVAGILAGNNLSNTLSLQAAFYHDWIVLADDRDGLTRLIGDSDKGAKLTYDYNSGDKDSSRKRAIKFTWQYPTTAPVYSVNLPVPEGVLILEDGSGEILTEGGEEITTE